jgi:hypothetical protein
MRIAHADHIADHADLALHLLNIRLRRRPKAEDAVSLAKRIGEFRQGCSVLLLAEHKPLPEAERVWLVNRCKTWAAKLDKHLTELEAGKDVLTVRAEMDETVKQIAAALQSRADQLRG